MLNLLPFALLFFLFSSSIASDLPAIRPRAGVFPKVEDPAPAPPPVNEEPQTPSSGTSNPYGEEGGSSGGTTSPGEGETPPIGAPHPGEAPEPGSNNNEEEDSETAEKIVDALQEVLDTLTELVSTEDSTTITSTATLPTAARPCASANSIYSYCNSVSANFSTALFTEQASCVCYTAAPSSGIVPAVTYAPNLFDGYISSCNTYVSTQTASQSFASQATGLAPALGLCSSVGDVRASATSSLSTTSAPTPTPIPPSTGGSAGRGNGMGQAVLGAGAGIVLGAGFW